MSINNKQDRESVLELGLALGFSYRCMKRRYIRNGFGAGANAGSSGLNMPFVTNNNPLSELVWSPLKGPRNVALLPAHRISATANFSAHNRLTEEEDQQQHEEYILTQNISVQMKSSCEKGKGGHAKIRDAEIVDAGKGIGCAEFRMDNVIRETQFFTFPGQSSKKMGDISSIELDQEAWVEAIPVQMDIISAKKTESTSENDVHNLVKEPNNEASASLELSRRVKGAGKVSVSGGKEEALSDEGDAKMTLSHESVESCNSTGLGKRRRRLKEGLACGSRGGEMKRQMHAKQDSSFMSWISNVMKGFSHTEREGDQPVPISIACPIEDGAENPDRRIVSFEKGRDPVGPHKIIGFRSIFDSLYCVKAEVRVGTNEVDSENKTSDINENPDGKFEKQVLLDSDNADEKLHFESSGTKDRTNSDSEPPKTTSNIVHRNDNLGSIWITRFSTKTPGSSSRPLNTQSEKFKLITSSDAITCFFCGKKGHPLQDCSQIAEAELDELLKNLKTYKGSKENFCVRCFENNHWGIACPNRVSSTKCLQVESSLKEMRISSVCNRENSKIGEDGEFSLGYHCLRKDNESRVGTSLALHLEETSRKTTVVKTNVVQKYDVLIENRIAPLSLFVVERNEEAPKGLFYLVRSLQLSRSDIMKWMNSSGPRSEIEGLFLRLRLGKWEEGLGGTGYHVACVIGAHKDSKQKGVKRSLVVNVGGIKCVVESRYISNNDFLEEELMAWWCISTRNGNKLPSEEDLKIKVKTRRISDLF